MSVIEEIGTGKVRVWRWMRPEGEHTPVAALAFHKEWMALTPDERRELIDLVDEAEKNTR